MEKSLFALCYPVLSENDEMLISEFRREFDLPSVDVVKPHFTIAFGVSNVPIESYTAHLKAQFQNQKKVNFSCRYAMLGSDHLTDDFYVFLVPDEGYGEISLLHDRFHKGAYEKYHLHNVAYTPHITVSNSKDSNHIKALCTELNEKGLEISGYLNGITVCEDDGRTVRNIETISFV